MLLFSTLIRHEEDNNKKAINATLLVPLSELYYCIKKYFRVLCMCCVLEKRKFLSKRVSFCFFCNNQVITSSSTAICNYTRCRPIFQRTKTGSIKLKSPPLQCLTKATFKSAFTATDIPKLRLSRERNSLSATRKKQC